MGIGDGAMKRRPNQTLNIESAEPAQVLSANIATADCFTVLFAFRRRTALRGLVEGHAAGDGGSGRRGKAPFYSRPRHGRWPVQC